MRRIAFCLLWLFLVLPVHAQEYDYVAGVGGVAVSKYCDTKSGYLICEDFEGASSCESGSDDSNCRNTWSAGTACAATVDYGYTTALDGTYSVLVDEGANGSACSKTITLDSINNVYAVARIKIGALSAVDAAGEENVILAFSSQCAVKVGYDEIGAVRFGSTVGSTDAWGSSITVTQGTEYYVWMEYVRNTSCAVYVSANGTKPGSPEATQGATNFATTSFGFQTYDFAYDIDAMVIDNILVDDAAIGNQ